MEKEKNEFYSYTEKDYSYGATESNGQVRNNNFTPSNTFSLSEWEDKTDFNFSIERITRRKGIMTRMACIMKKRQMLRRRSEADQRTLSDYLCTRCNLSALLYIMRCLISHFSLSHIAILNLCSTTKYFCPPQSLFGLNWCNWTYLFIFSLLLLTCFCLKRCCLFPIKNICLY